MQGLQTCACMAATPVQSFKTSQDARSIFLCVPKAYAEQHGLVLSTLYYWQSKIKAGGTSRRDMSTDTAAQPGKFIALQVKTAQHAVHPVVAIRAAASARNIHRQDHEFGTSHAPVSRA